MTPAAIEAVLADFRSWLLQHAALPVTDGAPAGPAPEPVDLHTLLGQFVALRHEVNLQTRATRAQQEQGAEAIRQLGQALDALSRAQSAAGADEDEALRPLLKTLVDVYDALSLAGREVRRLQDTLVPSLEQLTAAAEPSPEPAAPARPALWARLFGGAPAPEPVNRQVATSQRQQRQEQARQAAERIRQFLGSLVTGYTMSVQRIERALQQHGLEPIRTVGEPFDPESMEAVEVVAEGGRQTTEVIEEVRRGYRWGGRVFRYAQVRVARPEK